MTRNPLITTSQSDHFICATSVVYLIETILKIYLHENNITCNIETYPIKSNYNKIKMCQIQECLIIV